MSGEAPGSGSFPWGSIPDPIAVVEGDGRVVDCNDAAADLFGDRAGPDREVGDGGGSDGDRIGGADDEADGGRTHGDPQLSLPDPVAEAVETALSGSPEDGERGDAGPAGEAGSGDGATTVEATLDGSVYDCHVYPEDDRCAVVCHDVTDRRRQRRELERYETVLELLPVPVYIIDEEGRVEFINEAFWDLFGFEKYDLEEYPVLASMGMRPEDVERCREAILDCLSDDPETGDWQTVDIVVFTREGERIPVENRQAILVEDGEFRGTFGAFEDVSDHKRQRERLQVLDRVLRHNVRTEVSVLTGHAETIADRTDDREVVESTEAIRESGERILAISEGTREVGSALVGGDRSTVGLAEAVSEAVATVRESHPEADIEVAVDDSVAVVAGEALPTALVELVENAVVHNDDPHPAVRITADTGRANVASDTGHFHRREPVVVRIADEGPGIPQDERAVVAGDADVSALTHSDGLGLWTAVWIVEAYGGTLEIEDREGGGAVVEVSLVREE